MKATKTLTSTTLNNINCSLLKTPKNTMIGLFIVVQDFDGNNFFWQTLTTRDVDIFPRETKATAAQIKLYS